MTRHTSNKKKIRFEMSSTASGAIPCVNVSICFQTAVCVQTGEAAINLNNNSNNNNNNNNNDNNNNNNNNNKLDLSSQKSYMNNY